MPLHTEAGHVPKNQSRYEEKLKRQVPRQSREKIKENPIPYGMGHPKVDVDGR
jgi:hypothetical protein